MNEELEKLIDQALNDSMYPQFLCDYTVEFASESGSGGKVYHEPPIEIVFATD